jgi:hypothetical protein
LVHVEPLNTGRSMRFDDNVSFLRTNTMPDSKKFQSENRKTKLWLTTQFNDLDHFVIMPFSVVFYAWNTLLLITYTYVAFKVLYGVGWGQNYAYDPVLIFAEFVYIADIPIRLFTGVTEPKRITPVL